MTEVSIPSRQKTLVMKFGGTSVGSLKAMAQAVKIIQDTYRNWPRMVVVTSALSGVTNLLLDSAVQAAHGDLSVYQSSVQEITTRHHELVDHLVSDPVRNEQVHNEVAQLINDFSNLCLAMNVLREASPRALDTVAALGERLSVRILTAAVENTGLQAQCIESTRLIITDDHFQNALPDLAETRTRTQTLLLPLLEQGCIPITTGFIAATSDGATTTLGRGGSDYTASLLGVALSSTEVWIWTDVDGVMSADPRMVPDARTIPELSYREVAEMAHYGAKVLHPKSIHPVIEAGIGLRVCNTFNPEGPDTRLVGECNNEQLGMIRAVAAIRGLRMVTLSGRGMLGVPGVAGRIFSAVAKTGISVPLIIESTSEQAICFPAPKEKIQDVIDILHLQLENEFKREDIDRVIVSDDVDIITVVCPGLRTTPGISGQIFGILGLAKINVLGISFGASDVSINLIVSAQDTQKAVLSIHSLIP
jgi:aspartate kinase